MKTNSLKLSGHEQRLTLSLCVIRHTAQWLMLFALMFAQQAGADELPPGLEVAIKNPNIPMIVDATILNFNKEGQAEIKVNTVYKPAGKADGKAGVLLIVRGYASVGRVETRIVPMSILIDKGKTRFLFFLKGDLLFSTYNNRFEIREGKDKQLIVHTGRVWKPLKDMVKLIPKKTPRK